MTRTPLTVAVSTALLGVGVLAAGCGKSDDTTTGGTRTVTEPATRVEVIRELPGSGSAKGAPAFDPTGIYERESAGVVTVIATGLRGTAGRGDSGLGSGFVVSDEGEIATNAHVVTSGEGGDIRRATTVYVRFQDGNQVGAEIVGHDPFADVALLKLKDLKGLTLRPLPLGSSGEVRVGEPVAAIGSPFGEEQSLSIGVVSALDRSIDSLTGFKTSGAIQTDAAINHGNSGGPLLNAKGEVLGINSQIRTESGDGSGVGFAVPVDAVRRSIEQLRKNGKVDYAYLGVSSSAVYPQLAAKFDLPVSKGAWIQVVTKGGPADKSGIKAGVGEKVFQARPYAPGGDLIVAVEGKEVEAETDLGRLLLEHDPG
ncbi:S1C family serine protease, partial [Paraconexibacter sp.]|uniref:S1C family serine protease n=1 Tax=Paraconexibacter sp. TaxID=2949640 RepID=UPI0035670F18